MIKQNYLININKTKKPFIIYKSEKGFDLYTNFSKKIILTNKNIKNFINKTTKFNRKKKRYKFIYWFFWI